QGASQHPKRREQNMQNFGTDAKSETSGFGIKINLFGMKPSPPEAEFQRESNGNDENGRKL
ncbi:MAG: hypothetical protein VXW06_06820, partial [Pseudomonadota bacterium]|nr:hypothetical protein [Pseudomonadota bacterium]